jgi:YebC/PmpR family DNA-binding regulatory protein
MAGHSKFKNIQHRKGAQDAKRGKLFNKIAREITVAVKEGGDNPDMNPRLRAAIINARFNNMPNDRVQRATKAGSGPADGAAYEHMRYEGYGPCGVAILVDTLTDNRNRTASDVRSSFSKYGGNLGESGSVAFTFQRLGQITYPLNVATADAMFEAAVNTGADNVETDSEQHTISTTFETFNAVQDALQKQFGEAANAQITWLPLNLSPIAGDDAKMLFKLIDALEDLDDVQQVYTNFDIDAEELEKLAA